MTDERDADGGVRRAEDLLEERRRARDAADGAASEGAAAEDPRQRVEALTADLQRVAADFANYRRRNEAERSDFARFAKADLIRRLLEVLDDFGRALESVPEDARDGPWVEGMWLVERKMRDILASEGLEAVPAAGQPFDPHVHEAIAHVESAAPEGTVVDEVRRAYRLHDRILRPALVTVAKGPSGAGEKDTTRTPSGEKE